MSLHVTKVRVWGKATVDKVAGKPICNNFVNHCIAPKCKGQLVCATPHARCVGVVGPFRLDLGWIHV